MAAHYVSHCLINTPVKIIAKQDADASKAGADNPKEALRKRHKDNRKENRA